MGINLVEFEVRAIEDRNKTLESGHYAVIEKEFVAITVIGGNLTVEYEVNEAKIREWRTTPEKKYIYDKYLAWKDGKEAPINGYPLKEWPSASPGMVMALAKMKIRSVEELAELQDDALPKVGQPGTRAIRDKARSWLKVSADQGKIVEKITAMQLEIDEKDAQNEKLRIENEALKMLQAESATKKKVK
jgi:hypothetical protein